ncbi:MAG: hypothetical protein M1823_000220 [Watsoniomyces obsoletus]|nr:MAG: hypothetical protein M1823_000220 [Watsoniomyces obsoletus]
MSTTVHVSNIASSTSEHQVRDFFSFCGKITSLSVTPSSADPDSSKSATVTFEKETAAKTALLLDNTKLGDSHVKVEAGQGLDQLASGKTATSGDDSKESGDIEQEDKPRSRILAEYIAHGYVIGDNALHRAIDLDKKHGFSNRFTSALANFDNKTKATDRAKAVDASYGVTGRAQAGWRGLQSYFEKAMETPTGQRLRAFYTQTERSVMDIHNEARRLADLRKQEGGGDASGSGSGGENKVSSIPGTDKTVCSCAGNSGSCPCEEGKCACQGCGKSSIEGKGHSATGPADDVAAATHLNPLGSNLTHEATGNADQFSGDSKVAPVGDQFGGGKTG